MTDQSLADRAYVEIEDLIVSMELAPGSWVSEPKLSARLEIGRTPVREALLRLASDGVLVTRPRRGMLVREIDIQTQMRVLEARRALEVPIAERAALRRSATEAEAIAEMLEGFRALQERDDHLGILRHDRVFMDLLLGATGNPFLRGVVPLYALSRRFWMANYPRQNRYRAADLAGHHIAIGQAVLAGDTSAARRRTETFLDFIEAFTRFAGLELD